jgi:pimeloyl-ACP methyl ester carboxylesterase
MSACYRIGAFGVLAAAMMLALGSIPGTAQSRAETAQARAHVYLLRGLMNIFSLGMDSLAEELSKRGVYTTVSNHSEWQSLADQAASNYKAGKEDPIILIGHSLGADAVMQMAAYLNRKNIPVALVVPFDGTGSFSTPANVGRLVNLTQRNTPTCALGLAFMARSPMSKR